MEALAAAVPPYRRVIGRLTGFPYRRFERHSGQQPGKGLHLLLEGSEVGDEHEQAAEAQLVGEHVAARDDQDGRRHQGGEHTGGEGRGVLGQNGPATRLHRRSHEGHEVAVLPTLLAEGLHDGDAGQGLLYVGLHAALGLAP